MTRSPYETRRSQHGHASPGEGDRRTRRARRREDREGAAGRSLPGADRDDAVGADQGRGDGGGLFEAVQGGAHAEVDGEASGRDDREADLPGELLSQQGRPRDRGLPPDRGSLRRDGALDDGRAADAADERSSVDLGGRRIIKKKKQSQRRT